MTTLAMATMVKDEARHIRRMMDSIIDLVDEIHIEDTGSTDGTLEILREYESAHDKVHIYQQPWESDFSAHRNRVMLKCESDFILVLDGDESFSCSDPAQFRERVVEVAYPVSSAFNMPDGVSYEDIRELGLDGYRVAVVDAMEDGSEVRVEYLPRVFKNRKGPRYSGAVHNKFIVRSVMQDLPASLCKIRHHGYSDKEKMGRRWQRTSTMLEQQKAELGRIVVTEQHRDVITNHVYLIAIHQAGGHYAKAIREGKELFKFVAPRTLIHMPLWFSAFGKLALSYFRLELYDDAKGMAMAGLCEKPDDIDLTYMMGVIESALNEKQRALAWFIRWKSMTEGLSADNVDVSNSLGWRDRIDDIITGLSTDTDVEIPFYG